MLDGKLRPLIDPALTRMAVALASAGVSANAVTWSGLAIALLAMATIWQHWFIAALVLIAISRLADGLDGAVARISGKSDYGGFLDIVLDFGFYGAIPLGFALADPAANAVAACVLLVAFYFNGGSVLAFAVMAEKRGVDATARGQKSLLFTTGIAEATETYLAFAAMCLLPAWFPVIAYSFAAIVLYTALSRIMLASRAL